VQRLLASSKDSTAGDSRHPLGDHVTPSDVISSDDDGGRSSNHHRLL